MISSVVKIVVAVDIGFRERRFCRGCEGLSSREALHGFLIRIEYLKESIGSSKTKHRLRVFRNRSKSDIAIAFHGILETTKQQENSSLVHPAYFGAVKDNARAMHIDRAFQREEKPAPGFAVWTFRHLSYGNDS